MTFSKKINKFKCPWEKSQAMMKKVLLLSIAFIMCSTSAGNAAAELVYDDFDDGLLGTNQGGQVGPMSPDLNSDGWGDYDPTIEFTADSAEGPYALSLTYNFASGQWCGYWSYANDGDPDAPPDETLDVSSYSKLKLWVKGTLGTEQFKIELKSSDQEVSYYYVTNLGTEWKEVEIPFSSFTKVPWVSDPVDFTRLRQLNIVFDRAPLSSTVYIDTIEFVEEGAAPQPPTADFEYTPTSPSAGETVMFDATASTDPDGTITSYSWNFGDGTEGTGATVSHTYSSGGEYSVTLTVIDNDGLTDTKTLQLTVQSTGGGEENNPAGGGEPINFIMVVGVVVIIAALLGALIWIKHRTPTGW